MYYQPCCGLLNLSCLLVILGRIYGAMNNLFNWSTAPFIFPLVDTLWWSVFCMLEKRTKNMLVYLSSFSQEKVTVSAGYDCVGIPKQTKASSSLFESSNIWAEESKVNKNALVGQFRIASLSTEIGSFPVLSFLCLRQKGFKSRVTWHNCQEIEIVVFEIFFFASTLERKSKEQHIWLICPGHGLKNQSIII